jgi:Cu+-exporting ATPase
LPKPFRIEELEKALAGILASPKDLNQLTKGEKMATQIDPVCGMKVDEEKAAGQSEYENHTYYFYASFCKRNFDQYPEKYVDKSEEIKRN